ncbi:amino acid ABC transporter permease [Ideonella sp. TBM-1]|uniref:Amino acid ABC transporter permease n=2 Tax=Ideonella livida TaxID=2707176 RepID=A0A7C9TI70_9BURK|nr:amino acid ABC transporter permease [Ideonella livida]
MVAALAWAWGPALLDWAWWSAVWRPDAEACQAVRGQGACWGVVAEKHRLILLGRYPQELAWRPVLATVLLLGAVAGALWPPAAAGGTSMGRRVGLAVCGLCGAVFLLHGWPGAQAWGLGVVETDRWGGLPLSLLLSAGALVAALPLGTAVAVGRREGGPVLRRVLAWGVELVRGLPLVAVLFTASFLFPLWWPGATAPDVLLRVWLAMTLFATAYLSETIRAGLQALEVGQQLAGASLGLPRRAIYRWILLPQALIRMVPALVNSAIGLFKDSALVTVVSLYELTGSLGLALQGDPVWRPFLLEGTLFITALYFAGCAGLSAAGRALEARWTLRRGR